MLKKLKKIISEIGIVKVTHDLGYLSHGTLCTWFRNNKIPLKAQEKVKEYLKEKGL